MVRAFGLYHAIAILPFVLPLVSEHVINQLGQVHMSFALTGTWMNPNSNEMMFVNLFAVAALVWALYRFFHPSITAGKYEGWGMLLFSLIVVFYVANGASAIWLLIPLVDLPGGLMHLYFGVNQDHK